MDSCCNLIVFKDLPLLVETHCKLPVGHTGSCQDHFGHIASEFEEQTPLTEDLAAEIRCLRNDLAVMSDEYKYIRQRFSDIHANDEAYNSEKTYCVGYYNVFFRPAGTRFSVPDTYIPNKVALKSAWIVQYAGDRHYNSGYHAQHFEPTPAGLELALRWADTQRS